MPLKIDLSQHSWKSERVVVTWLGPLTTYGPRHRGSPMYESREHASKSPVPSRHPGGHPTTSVSSPVESAGTRSLSILYRFYRRVSFPLESARDLRTCVNRNHVRLIFPRWLDRGRSTVDEDELPGCALEKTLSAHATQRVQVNVSPTSMRRSLSSGGVGSISMPRVSPYDAWQTMIRIRGGAMMRRDVHYQQALVKQCTNSAGSVLARATWPLRLSC